jgi:hypothetical protein
VIKSLNNKMIVHGNQRGPTMVRVINSRLPVYRATYGDGLGDVVQGLFTRIAPKAIPIAKQLGMKAIDVVREKGIGAVGNLASKAFSAIKDRLTRLIRRPARPQPVKLASTEVMPASVSKIINQAANQKLLELADVPMSEKEKSITASLIAGSGLRVRQRR